MAQYIAAVWSEGRTPVVRLFFHDGLKRQEKNGPKHAEKHNADLDAHFRFVVAVAVGIVVMVVVSAHGVVLLMVLVMYCQQASSGSLRLYRVL